MLPRYIVEAPVELLVETPQKSCGDLARQRMIDAEDARRSHVDSHVHYDGINQVAAVILAAKKMRFVNGLRELKFEADCRDPPRLRPSTPRGDLGVVSSDEA